MPYSSILYYQINWIIAQNTIAYNYYNGTHPDNLIYKDFNGYKTTSSSRTDNIPDGWYILNTGVFETNFRDEASSQDSINVSVYYIKDGKIEQQKIITINK